MPYNSVISRSEAAALIPEQASREIIQQIVTDSPLLRMARRLPNMSRGQMRMPVMSALATAYFVSPSDTGLKQTTEVNWANKYVDAEEIAAIVPIPESVLNDADYDIWGELRPALVQAFNRAIAQAVLYGTNIPATWTTNLGAAGIVAGATAATQTISLANYADIYEAIMSKNAGGDKGLLMLIEEDGYIATGHMAAVSLRGELRGLRDVNGNPIFTPMLQDVNRYQLDGAPIEFPLDGSIVPASSLDIAGQWDQLVYAIRQDITYKVLDQAVITDGNGAIQYNLAQQDMVALRAVMRLGFALPNPINAMNVTAATRFPFAVLTA